jgi:signal peptidase I
MRPWLTVWIKPGDMIEHVLARNPRHSIWLLAALGGIGSIVAQLIGAGWASASVDWRALTALAVVGSVYGVVGLYINAWCLLLIGKMLGGQASAFQLRALLAWGGLPYIVVLAITVAVLGIGSVTSVSALRIFFLLFQAVILILILWSLFMTLRMIARAERFGIWRSIVTLLFCMALSFGIAMSIRTFLFQPFNTPSGSNKPTLLVGDYIFVSKYAYGYTHYSLPFSLPLFSGRIWATEPQRGDNVVFRLPRDTSTDYVKRIVGLPGDRIQMIEGVLHINGTPIKRERIEDFLDIENSEPTAVKQWRETLPNGVSYATLDLVDNGFADNTQVFTVPPKHYFVIGDNRDNSTDSRFNLVGMIPFENLIGRVVIVFYSVDPGSGTIRFNRIGKAAR